MKNFITKATFEEVQRELDLLRDKLIKQAKVVSEALSSGGGWHDNAVYDIARNDQMLLENRNERLNDFIKNPEFIDDLRVNPDSVQVGTRVCLKVKGEKEEVKKEYIILGIADAEFGKDDRIISHESPIAKCIIGASVGDICNVVLPSRSHQVEIVGIALADL